MLYRIVLWCAGLYIPPLIARFMEPTWGPPGADRTQVAPMFAPWTLLSGIPGHVVTKWIKTTVLNYAPSDYTWSDSIFMPILVCTSSFRWDVCNKVTWVVWRIDFKANKWKAMNTTFSDGAFLLKLTWLWRRTNLLGWMAVHVYFIYIYINIHIYKLFIEPTFGYVSVNKFAQALFVIVG